MEFDLLKLELDGAVATLIFNDPDNLNAMSEPMLTSFEKALDVIEDPETGVRCLILTGAGRGFCAGANVTRMDSKSSDSSQSRPNANPDAGAGLERVYHPILRRLRNLHCPIVSAVNGPCAGIGMRFALMGDMIIAGKSAFFLQAFRRIGLVPDGGATYLLPRIIGMARARELTLMGERLPAETALEWGLINRVAEDASLMDDAKQLAQDLAKGPMSLGMIRELLWSSVDAAYEEQLNNERMAQRTAGRTNDFAEGVAAFKEKRETNFQGQ